MMKINGKRILSLMLAVSMVWSSVPAGAWASSDEVGFEAEEVSEEPELSGNTDSAAEPEPAEEVTVEEAPVIVGEEISETPDSSGSRQSSGADSGISIDSVETEPDFFSSGIPEEEKEESQGEDGETMSVGKSLDVDTSGLADSDELIEDYIERLFDTSGTAVTADHGSRYLSGTDLTVYNQLREAIEKIAAGKKSSTVISISGVSYEWTYSELGLSGNVSSYWADLAAWAELSDSFGRILNYLLVDCPYDLYWFDKTVGLDVDYKISTGDPVKISNISFSFYVCTDYRGTNSLTVDTSKTSVATDAASNAQEIAKKHKSEPVEQRLTSYKEEICDLVSYDESVSWSTSYGDPWQLVYVFDGDKSTNVVCEGYAKAFQYLCDLDGGDEVCYIVTGWLSGGSHMWNVVRIDKESYLVDVTNSDTDTVGENGGLFLVGASDASSVSYDKSGYPAYTFKVGGSTLTYTYDSDTRSIYPVYVLTLGTISAVSLSSCTVTLSKTSYTYNGSSKKPGVTVKDGNITLKKGTDYSVSYSNNTNAGTATAIITGKGDYTGTVKKNYTINKASQTVKAKASSSSVVKGKTATITASGKGKITYSSNNKSVATVSSKGKITAKSPGTVKIKVKAAGNSNYKSATKTLTIKVKPKATTLKSVKNSSSKKITVKWKKVSGVTGYQIQYSTSKSFKSGSKTKSVKVSGASTVKKKISGLKKGKTYYVRVRTYKKVSGTNYYSKWSSKKQVKIKK